MIDNPPSTNNIEVKKSNELNDVYEYDISRENQYLCFCKKIDVIKTFLLCCSTPVTVLVISGLFFIYSIIMVITFFSTNADDDGFSGLKTFSKVIQIIVTVGIFFTFILKIIAVCKEDPIKAFYSYFLTMIIYVLNTLSFLTSFIYFCKLEVDGDKGGSVFGFVVFGIVAFGIVIVIAYYILYLEFMLYLYLKYIKKASVPPEPLAMNEQSQNYNQL